MAGACASTHAEAAHAASQAMLAEPGEPPGTAVDGLCAGILALAATHPSVLLGAGTILLGGMGEGQLAIDGRARQPGLGAQRPRGFTDGQPIPDGARVAAPTLPSAIVLAHAGRGERTLTHLSRIALASASQSASVPANRGESIRAFGREGSNFLRGGGIRSALLAATARSRGGMLTEGDLDGAHGEVVAARTMERGKRSFSIAPWCVLDGGLDGGLGADAPSEPLSVIVVADARGALAIAVVLVPALGISLDETGLIAPLLASPVMRGVTREAPASIIAVPAPIATAKGLAVGVTGGSPAAFAALLGALGDDSVLLEDACKAARPSPGGRVVGVFVDGSNARALRAS